MHWLERKLGRHMGIYACGRWGDRADFLTASLPTVDSRGKGLAVDCKGCVRALTKRGEAFARQLAGVCLRCGFGPELHIPRGGACMPGAAL